MNLPISLYVALRYWRAKSADRFGRLVANLASFGIVLGVMALIIVLSVMNGLEGYQKQQDAFEHSSRDCKPRIAYFGRKNA